MKYQDDRGHVFGGGEGLSGANPYSYDTINPYSGTGTAGILNNKSLLDLMATVRETHVTISDSAYVKGSVYGGSMSGHVLNNAYVTVSGGQIGAGYNPADPDTEQNKYKEKQFIDPVRYFGSTHTTFDDVGADSVLFACYRWDYDPDHQQPFDPINLKTVSGYKPTNGETWFGHVFGGGSGYYPYIKTLPEAGSLPERDTAIWNPDAGKVYGHTEVEITGGHILSNVYGGCQTTDVGNYVENSTTLQLYNNSVVPQVGNQAAKAIVTMSGGTVGVPRTKSSIQEFPFTSNVYGGGQGNFADHLKALNNVDSTRVVIKEVSSTPKPIVYGNVFGGSQNAHILDSTKVLIKGGVIGTTGLSGYDGLVFGGGQGTVYVNPHYADDTLYAHAGRVGGNTRVIMSGGKVLGNLYGGGMVALTGVDLNGWFDAYTNDDVVYDSTNHGLCRVEVTGGFVGNYFNNGLNLLTCSHPSGNVYGGGRGKLDEYHQDDLGRSANAAVKISGSPHIYGSVFGGGEMANVGYWRGYDLGWYATKTAATRVNITGSPKIGTELEFKDTPSIAYSQEPGDWTYYDTIRFVKYAETSNQTNDTAYLRMLTHTRTGHVYGGGQGEVKILGSSHSVLGLEQGHCATTNVYIGGSPTIRGSVFGGSEEGVVWGETEVHIAGGTIGTEKITPDSLKYNHGTHSWSTFTVNKATYSYGNVFGGSYGKDYYSSFSSLNITNPRPTMIDSVNNCPGRVYGNTLVDITGGAIRGNVYGGGDMASVGIWDSVKDGSNHFVDIKPIADSHRPAFRGNTTVNISQATGNTTIIGPLDGTGLNGYVFGGGKGFSSDPDQLRKVYCNVDSTFVTVSGGTIWGSVFGGGNDAHVLGSTSVIVHSGANIGTNGLSTWDGNIFGGGRNFQNSNHSNGRVAGNIDITMDGGTLQGSIFGGGRLALTGVNMSGNPYVTDHVYDSAANGKTIHGLVTINVSGEYDASQYSSTNGYSTSIGNPDGDKLLNGSDESVGDIFGSGKGDTKAYDDILAGRVANSKINITGSPRIFGSVFGGGEMAGIGYWYEDNGKAKFYDHSGASEVTIGSSGSSASQSANLVIGTYYEFDPEYLTNSDHDWTVYDEATGTVTHTCTGNVFGGSQGDVDPTCPHWVSMGRSRKSKVTVNSGNIMSRVFGGAEQGTVATNTSVTINGGIIGTLVTKPNSSETYYMGGVYGGGYGSHKAELNVTHPNDSLNVRSDLLAGRVYGNILVDVLGGTIRGNVYGGASYAYIGGYGASPNGNVQLNIGSPSQEGYPNIGTTILGSVFGSNNHSGTPLGYVNVDVYHTAHRTWTEDGVKYTNYAPILTDTVWSPDMMIANINGTGYFENIGKQRYAIKEVFAGGNHASYTPNETRGVRDATVHVHYCENTIEDLYGGSNAADIGTSDVHANDSVIVDGGRFYRVFGGGNGTTTFANVHGTAVTRINAGVIQEVYGGGNHNGIIDDIDLEITHDNAGTCGDFIYDVFGGNNEAEVIGDIVSVINCGDGYQYEFYGGNNTATIYGNVTTNVFGGETAYLFGGSKGSDDVQAHIRQFPSYAEITADTLNHYLHPNVPRKYSNTLLEYMGYPDGPEPDYVHTGGNVTLNIFGGTISEAAFGGSDENGTIDGKITVNVFDADIACALDLNNLYGAGRKTSYEPIYDLPTGTTERISPEINVIHGTVKGYVYGGGKGNEATTKASPKVNIGYDALTMGPPTTEGTLIDTLFGTIHHYVDTIKPEDPEHSYHWQAPAVADYAAKVKHNVYGGGELAQVAGNTRVNIYAGVVGDSIGHIENHLGADSTFLGLYAYQLQGGRVFGGGEGSETNKDHGLVTGNATVTMTGGKVYKNVYGGGELASVGTGNLTDKNSGVATVIISGGEVGPLDGSGENAYVFGGGRGKVDSSSPTAYGDFANVDSTSVIISDSARIYGSVFGGSEDGHVLGDARMQILGKTGTKDTIPLIGTNGMTSWDGNLFGGGRNFRYVNFTAGRVGGNTTVEMTNGTVYGNIYGGGRLALTGVDMDGDMQTGNHGNTKVMVKGGTVGNNTSTHNTEDPAETVIETFTYFSMGNIYGGGKGISMDPAPISAEKALLLGLTKNTSIEISDTLGHNTHVYGIVLGGGEIANVGKYTLTKSGGNITNIAVTDGLAEVKVSGGIIGGNRSQMRYQLEEPDSLTNWYSKYNDDLGYVYGGGEGWSANPADYISVGDTSLVDLVATVQRTEVTITNDTTKIGGAVSRPWVKASVFGGSESGHVKGNTKVTIAGGQIGAGTSTVNGKPVDLPMYTDGSNGTTNQYINPLTNPVTTTPTDNTLVGTYHWDYAAPHNPYDPAKIRNQYNTTTNTYGYVPCDGKSWFGNVFGGGSGWFPYVTGTTAGNFESHWNPLSGKVWGNTEVIIKGGHILNNVYGANESTDVGGKATIKMSGGTVGVPRTAGQVALQPVTSYIFGGGCGDPREIFDNETNVASTDVQITGGIVYGSVFGGAEDGHVLGNVDVKIGKGDEFTVGEAPNAITYTYPVIGSTGTSSADGNLFGGGRNFSHENNEAGRVAGNINIDMDGGVFLGSIYGGGRMGSAGVDVHGDNITTDPTLHGNVTIDISGGTVGNDSKILDWLATPDHTSMGDVFGGGMGNREGADLGRVRNTNVKIWGDARVLNNVYGGGELANVGWATTPGDAFDSEKGGLAKIEISGGQVGIERIGTNQVDIKGGYVYGGGLGLAGGLDVLPFANVDTTRVEIRGDAYITSSVFGGADNGHVWRNTSIVMEGGIVGQPNTLEELTVDANEQPVSHIYTGSVIGGGRGTTPIATTPVTIYHDTTGIVFGNTTIDIKGDAVVRKGVYGGGGLSHVGTFTRDASGAFTSYTKGKCTVSVMGNAHIGPTKADLDSYTETDKYNIFFNNLGGNAGWVFGAGCGLANLPDLTFCDSTLVTIGGTAQVTGAVFGGGENGHVLDSTHVVISGGTIGGIPLHGTGSMSGTGAFNEVSFTATTNELFEDVFGSGPRVFRGNVYGGGKGNDTIADPSDKLVYNRHAGQVYGKSKVEIKGGTIYNRVFGGGLLASVGTFNYAASNTDSIVGVVDNTGLAKVIVSGGTIGNSTNNINNGDVFGGGRGLVGRHWEPNYTTGDQVVNLAYVGSTEVTVESEAKIYGNVYGGSSSGHVQKDAHVIVKGGTIGIQGKGGWHSNVYGGGGGQHQYVRDNTTNPVTTHHSITSGRVYGNTKVEIKGGEIKHNVYGGGAIASVGTYNIYDQANLIKPGTGETEVTITGGTIGTDGNENGMVFGSGRGQIAPIGAFMDSLSYAVNTVVNIGKETSSGYEGTAKVKGSVYGSGENGHVFQKATVNVYSGTIGCEPDTYVADHFAYRGNVYGAGCGTDQYIEGDDAKYNPRSGIVQGNTEVNIYGGHISRNVYGGGAMAMVGTYLPYGLTGNWGSDINGIVENTGKAVVNVSGGTIGTSNAPEGVDHGNVYGGSRGPETVDGFTNMTLTDTSYVFISGGHVLGSVYGGGAKSWTRTARVATVSGGTVEKNVFGGSQNGLDDGDTHPFTSLKTANVRGGHIKGNVYGSSYIADEKTAPNDWVTGNNYWSSFVNITGGTIDGNVYAAGYGGEVKGSVCVNIGLTAVNKAPTNTNQTGSTQANVFRNAGLGSTPLGRGKLKIGGDIFGGSYVHQTGGVGQPVWDHNYDITGYSTMFIDGDGYNTTSTDESVANYMNLGGGIYGSGNYCESGEKGRTIILRRYGTRNNNANDELLTATRSLTTIQRGGIVLIDSTNVNLTGGTDISGQYIFKQFGVLQVDLSLFVANGSGIVLGEPSSKAEVFMDSIRSLRSLYLEDGHISYNQMGSGATSHWQMVGINNSDDNLYRINVSGTSVFGVLDKVKENVIIFNGTSRLWVRYNDKTTGTRKYGELYGFFRMRQPFPVTSLDNFAEARPKLTDKNNPIEPYTAGNTWNKGDGGFLSYVSSENDFTTAGHTTWFDYPATYDDGGAPYTNTKQYPYLNIGSFLKTDNYQDMETYRVWAKPTTMAHKWYVDGRGIGTGGWGQDKTHGEGWGDYPDKPKLTVSGAATGGSTGGICIDNTPNQSGYIFDPENDIIFVVGPIDASLEDANLNQNSAYPLKLYRYPGGHVMSNNKKDTSTLANPCPSAIMDTLSVNHNGLAGNSGLTGALVNAGPGPNYGTMVLANRTDNFVMDNVVVNGLYAYDAADSALYKIPESFATEKLKVSEPLVVTTSGSTTTLKGGTTLTNGYNNVDAGASTAWYTNPDYVATSGVHDGGALYVAPDIPASGDDPAVITTVNVEGLVNITGNKQKKGSGDPIYCNVYLPTFSKSLTISNSLDENTHIGVTSPIRNKAASYVDNTFSPVAVAVTSEHAADTVRSAWKHRNFHDDLDWFFVNDHRTDQPEHERTTYYRPTPEGKATNGNTLYFGWTWANVVRKQPASGDLSGEVTDDFNYTNINSAYDLAWLISQSTGMNGQTATDFHDVPAITQTADIDLNKYVWVPIGKKEEALADKAFAGHYDGRGHLITNLNIDYIGIGDKIYERNEYGLFGAVKSGSVNRTFVVSGRIRPAAKSESSKAALDESYLPEAPENDTLFNNEDNLENRGTADAAGPYNIGGLVGYLQSGTVSNSEAAITVPFVSNDSLVVGGLVGLMANGTVHSSMAMPLVNEIYGDNVDNGLYWKGLVGGLVGSATSGHVLNSFASDQFGIGGNTTRIKIGGLVGKNAGANLSNCYVALRSMSGDHLTTSNFGSLAAINSSGTIDYCYSMKYLPSNLSTALSFTYTIDGDCGSLCSQYTPTMSSDVYGYMYADNKVKTETDSTALFLYLNEWVDRSNRTTPTYARWARPALPEINGDLPVLLLADSSAVKSGCTNDFRSLATYDKSAVLQYGGPARDGNDKHLSTMLTRDEYVFVYGDVDGHDGGGYDGDNELATVTVNADKVSIYEHASIKYPGKLAELTETYVGITFDNSCSQATSTPGINYGLNGLGMGGYPLPRDWHMFSSPLQAAPLGFNYEVKVGDESPVNTNNPIYELTYTNNPWNSSAGEFSWLQSGGSTNIRYWMKGWDNSQSQNGQLTDATGSGWVDGYFPSRVVNAGTNVTGFGFSEGCINESWASEYGLYPYGMDFYTWTEPDYHWINFKRNGPNHWKSDGEHEQIDYEPVNGATKKQNEDNLIVGRGYMAAIATETFMQSHGMLNTGSQSIKLTNTSSSRLPGWNLVGNPFHGYIDFDKLAVANSSVLSTDSHGDMFYVVYNADSCINEDAMMAFRYYPKGGSAGGEYAERYLHPHQGFYVRAKSNSESTLVGNLSFTQDMLVTRDTIDRFHWNGHFRGEQPAYPLVNLYLSSDKGCADVTVIEFERPEWGGATKMKELRSGNGLFYAHHDNVYYAACFAQEGTDRVPLWFEAKEDDIFTIKWNTANGDFHSMYLIDNITGIQYDMLRNDTYTFEGHKNDYWSRFLIVFNVTDVDENLGHDLFVFFDGSEWVVTGEGDLEFVDVLGHVLMRTHVNDGQSRVRLPKVASGVYLMRLTNGEKCRVQKVIVNNK